MVILFLLFLTLLLTLLFKGSNTVPFMVAVDIADESAGQESDTQDNPHE